jgi:hypothetical protein
MNPPSDHAVILKPENHLLQTLQSGQLLYLTDIPGTGLILQKAFHCELIGPGAAVGGMFDLGCRSIYTLGKVSFAVPTTAAERGAAFNQRIVYVKRLQEITIAESPLRRADSILRYLDQIIGLEKMQPLPEELIAQMVGVFPSTLAMAVRQYQPDPAPVINVSAIA